MSPKLELRSSQIQHGAIPSVQMQQALTSGIVAVYTRVLKHFAWSTQAPTKLKQRTHWFDALIRLELQRCHTESVHVHHLEYVSDQGVSPQIQLRRWQKVSNRRSTVDRLSEYEKMAMIDGISDMDGTKQLVGPFLAEMHCNTESLRAEAEELKERRAQQMAESSHGEAKRGLIPPYLPLNLAIGVFGMDIQQINSSGHLLWVVTIIAVLMLLGTAAFSWLIKTSRQAYANAVRLLGFIESEKHDGLPGEVVLEKHSKSIACEGKVMGKWYHGWRKVLILAVCKPLEEVDLALVGQAKRRISEQRVDAMVQYTEPSDIRRAVSQRNWHRRHSHRVTQ